MKLKKKDGTPVLIEIDEPSVKDGTGRLVAISGGARDVTRQKRWRLSRIWGLGAIRKPYTLENIGIAVKKELGK